MTWVWVVLHALKYAVMTVVVFLPASYRRRRDDLLATPTRQRLVLATGVGLCLGAYALHNSVVTAAFLVSRYPPAAMLLPVVGGVLVYGQLRLLRDRVSLVRVLAAAVLGFAMVMGLETLAAEGFNPDILDARLLLVRYAAIGNMLMFDWQNGLAIHEQLLIYGVWIRGLADGTIWKTAVVVCMTAVELLVGWVMIFGMH